MPARPSADAQPFEQARPHAEQRPREQDREDRHARDDQRGEAGRHARLGEADEAVAQAHHHEADQRAVAPLPRRRPRGAAPLQERQQDRARRRSCAAPTRSAAGCRRRRSGWPGRSSPRRRRRWRGRRASSVEREGFGMERRVEQKRVGPCRPRTTPRRQGRRCHRAPQVVSIQVHRPCVQAATKSRTNFGPASSAA